MKNQGIYSVLNTINNKRYIGSSTNMYRRKQEHFSALKKGRHHNSLLQDDYNNYGLEAFKFEILQDEVDKKDLYKFERNFIVGFASFNNGYNQSLPNEESGNGIFSDDVVEKLRRASYKHSYGETTEEEYQEWLKKKNTIRTPEEVKKIMQNKLGISVYGICRDTNKILYEFNSLNEAKEILGVAEGSIRRARKNPRYTVKGLHLILKEAYIEEKDYRIERRRTS